MQQPRKFIFSLAAWTIAIIGLVGLFNRVIDPFWLYRDISIRGLNANKPFFLQYERTVKPLIVKKQQPEVLIFGSSFTEIGLDPSHPALAKYGRGYNFAMAKLDWDDMYCAVEFSLKHDRNLRLIILGINPEWPMRTPDCTRNIVKMENPDYLSLFFSLSSLKNSLNTIAEQRNMHSSHTADGRFFYNRWGTGTDRRMKEDLLRELPCKLDDIDASYSASLNYQGDFQTKASTRERSGLRQLLRDALSQGIDIKLVAYPRHAFGMEGQYLCGTRPHKWQELQEVATLVEQENKSLRGNAEIWDFEEYSPITAESVTAAPGHYWQDAAHFNVEFGNIMLDRMFSSSPARDTGLTSENIARRARDEAANRKAYIATHPEFVTSFKKLLQ